MVQTVLQMGWQGAGLRYINASVSQMLSGSCILFTAGLSVVVLRAKLNKLHYIGAPSFAGAVVVLHEADARHFSWCGVTYCLTLQRPGFL